MFKIVLATVLAAYIALVAASVGQSATLATVTWTGDRALVTTFKVDDGMTGKPGYRRALWTARVQPLTAILRVRNVKGKLVETEQIAGPVYARNEALTWRTMAVGSYRLTLVLTSPTGDTATASWVALLR